MKEDGTAQLFFYSPSLGLPIPLDCCPAIFIEQEMKAMVAYLRQRGAIREESPMSDGRNGSQR